MPHNTYVPSPLCHTIHNCSPHYATQYITTLPTMSHNAYLPSPLCHRIHTLPLCYVTQYIPTLSTMPHHTHPSSRICHTGSTYITALTILLVQTQYPPQDHLIPCLLNFRHNNMTVCCFKTYECVLL